MKKMAITNLIEFDPPIKDILYEANRKTKKLEVKEFISPYAVCETYYKDLNGVIEEEPSITTRWTLVDMFNSKARTKLTIIVRNYCDDIQKIVGCDDCFSYIMSAMDNLIDIPTTYLNYECGMINDRSLNDLANTLICAFYETTIQAISVEGKQALSVELLHDVQMCINSLFFTLMGTLDSFMYDFKNYYKDRIEFIDNNAEDM